MNTARVLCLILMLLATPTLQSRQACAQSSGFTFREEGTEVREQAQEQVLQQPIQMPILEKAVDPDQYVLGPNDQLLINIMGPESRTFMPTILPEGDVFIPGVGAIHADGLSLSDFRKELSKRVSKYYKNIELFCHLLSPRVFRVFVTGEVANPGFVKVSAVQRVSDAIERAGGMKKQASSRLITLEREGEVIRVDLLRFQLKGDLTNNPYLRGGDRVHVPPGGWRVVILGQIWKPGFFEIVPGETIYDLIDLAGGFTAEALKDSVLVSRIEEPNRIATFSVTSDRFDLELKDLDEVNTYEARKEMRRVFVFGEVRRTGRFFLAPGEGLSELLVRAGSFNEFADLEHASLQRGNSELIAVNLKDYLVPGDDDGLLLNDGDILHVPNLSRTVTVGGEVQVPGEFLFRNEWTVVQYIGLAGGPTSVGSVDRIVIYSSDGTSRNADGDSRPNRGDVIIVKRSKARIFSEFFSGLLGVTAVVISIVALTK